MKNATRTWQISVSEAEVMTFKLVHPVESFLQWLSKQPRAHQVELSEFIGHFCYPELFQTLKSNDEKIFACKEYLKANIGFGSNEEKLLLLINEIIEFIIEINEIADSSFHACEEVISEFPGIGSLSSILRELPTRYVKWLMTYHEWLRFKKQFSFFNSPKIFSYRLPELSLN